MARPKKRKKGKPKAKKGKKSKSPKRKKRRRRKKPTKRAFEKRPRKASPESELKLPEGFTIALAAATTDEAYATIQARLDDANASLPEELQGRVLVHAYADGSVDGELYVNVPEGMDDREVEFDLYEAFTNVSVGQRFWISFGGRYQVETDDERYKRYKGGIQVQTNYQRASQSNIAETHLVLRQQIQEGMNRRFGERASSVFVRLHWNLQNEQPKR